MNDVARVRSRERLQHQARHVRRRDRGQVAAPKPVFQGFAFEPFHGDVGRSVRREPVIEIAHDARMG